MNWVENHWNIGEFLVWDWYIGINEIYEEFSMAVFSSVRSFSKSKFPKHTLMRSFLWQFFSKVQSFSKSKFPNTHFWQACKGHSQAFPLFQTTRHSTLHQETFWLWYLILLFFSMHRINVHSKRNAAIKLQKHHFMGLKGYSVWLQNGQQWKSMKQ